MFAIAIAASSQASHAVLSRGVLRMYELTRSGSHLDMVPPVSPRMRRPRKSVTVRKLQNEIMSASTLPVQRARPSLTSLRKRSLIVS